MIPELGHYALVLALALSLVQSVLPVWGTVRRDARMMATARPVAVMLLVLVGTAFAALAWSYVVSDFSVRNVFENSHSEKPLVYKLSGVWGNHEGSMLLWILILTIFGALVAIFGKNIPRVLQANALAVQAWICSAFLLFILGTSNPFARLAQPPFEGQDLNPVLQDPGLAIHPPLLYLGYVGFSMAFSFAVAALIEGRIDAAWARFVRPWVLAAWLFLTLGIAMGSYWAYYELGWGGFWFWDPVENASLMPWIIGTALLHSAVVMERRDALKVWTILLSLLAFALSLLGTFLVRSGVLTSVHAFAVDPARGVAILLILFVFIGGSFALYAWRAPLLRPGGIFAPVSREGALVLNNLLLSAACVAVFFGTLYPLALEALTGRKISVGAPFFDATFGPLMLAGIIAMPFGPLLAWKRGDLLGAAQRLVVAAGAGVLAALLLAAFHGGAVLAPIGIGIALYAILGALSDLAERVRLGGVPFAESFARARGLPGSAWASAAAHAGIGLSLLGIVAATAYGEERVERLQPGTTISIAGYDLTYEGSFARPGPNFSERYARITVRQAGVPVAVLEPAKRRFPARQTETTEAAIATFFPSQLYLALGEATDGGIALRATYKPLVLLIWLGAVAMALGGVLALSDRRLRVGIPKPRRSPAAAVPAE